MYCFRTGIRELICLVERGSLSRLGLPSSGKTMLSPCFSIISFSFSIVVLAGLFRRKTAAICFGLGCSGGFGLYEDVNEILL